MRRPPEHQLKIDNIARRIAAQATVRTRGGAAEGTCLIDWMDARLLLELLYDTTHVTQVKTDQRRRLEDDPEALELSLRAMERRHVEEVMRKYRGAVEVAAKVLGISPDSLYRRIRSYKAEEFEPA